MLSTKDFSMLWTISICQSLQFTLSHNPGEVPRALRKNGHTVILWLRYRIHYNTEENWSIWLRETVQAFVAPCLVTLFIYQLLIAGTVLMPKGLLNVVTFIVPINRLKKISWFISFQSCVIVYTLETLHRNSRALAILEGVHLDGAGPNRWMSALSKHMANSQGWQQLVVAVFWQESNSSLCVWPKDVLMRKIPHTGDTNSLDRCG